MPAVTTPKVSDQFAIVDVGLDVTSGITLGGVREKPIFSWASLPDPAPYQWHLAILIDDESDKYPGDTAVIYSDGVNWRYAGDGSFITMEDIPVGQLVLTGSAPLLALGKVTVPTADLAITSVAPAREVVNNIFVDSGDILSSTAAPAIMPISVPATQLAITTLPPTGLATIPDAADITMSVTAPWLGDLAETQSVDMVLTGDAPTRLVDHNVDLGEEFTDITISLTAPFVIPSVSVPQGSVAVTTAAPIVAVGKEIFTPQGDLLTTVFAPTVGQTTNESDVVPQTDIAITLTVPFVASSIPVPQADVLTSTTAPLVSVSITVPQNILLLITTLPTVVNTTP